VQRDVVGLALVSVLYGAVFHGDAQFEVDVGEPGVLRVPDQVKLAEIKNTRSPFDLACMPSEPPADRRVQVAGASPRGLFLTARPAAGRQRMS